MMLTKKFDMDKQKFVPVLVWFHNGWVDGNCNCETNVI